jgi:uncharacterized protein
MAWRVTAGGLEVRVRATPRGGRDALDGIETLSDGRRALKIRVRAAPEAGAANEAARRLLAQALGQPTSAVVLTAGATARLKTFRIEGDGEALAGRLVALATERAWAS